MHYFLSREQQFPAISTVNPSDGVSLMVVECVDRLTRPSRPCRLLLTLDLTARLLRPVPNYHHQQHQRCNGKVDQLLSSIFPILFSFRAEHILYLVDALSTRVPSLTQGANCASRARVFQTTYRSTATTTVLLLPWRRLWL